MRFINWGKIAIVVLDIALAVYIFFGMTSFNQPDESLHKCNKVNITIDDENSNGFLSSSEIKHILSSNGLYPLDKRLSDVSPRRIEEKLVASPFINTAECYKTKGGDVFISVTQRTPLFRVKSETGSDYYVDDKGGVMPNSKYVSDIIIASGHVSKDYAQNYLAPLFRTITSSELWSNQIEQVNVLPDKGIELVPRVGNHIVYIGQLPNVADKTIRSKIISDYVAGKLKRLETFYRYGLSVTGWGKYSFINIEYDNQIICRRHNPSSQSTSLEDVKVPVSSESASGSSATTAQGASAGDVKKPEVGSVAEKPQSQSSTSTTSSGEVKKPVATPASDKKSNVSQNKPKTEVKKPSTEVKKPGTEKKKKS